MKPVTIDPRLHDAVIFDLDSVVGRPGTDVSAMAATVALARKLQAAGVATAAYSPAGQCEQVLGPAGIAESFTVRVDGAAALAAAGKLGVAPQRSVVVEAAGTGLEAASKGGFAVVIGVGHDEDAGELLRCGADVVVPYLTHIEVRTGDKRMSQRPNALDSYGQLVGIVAGRQPFICLDYDGTLSEIVPDPDAATLVDGASEALEHLAAQCPVAILSGRDLVDIRDRVGVPGIWYAGSHGFELIGPDGSYHQHDATAAAVSALENAVAELGDELSRIPGARVEHKRFAVAVHYRNVAAERVAEVIAAVHRHGQRDGLRVTSGRKVVELRPDIDWDKGTALAWIRDRIPQ
ncbi:MAG: trehalose-phosphatase, partial [Mycobacterium sp.]